MMTPKFKAFLEKLRPYCTAYLIGYIFLLYLTKFVWPDGHQVLSTLYSIYNDISALFVACAVVYYTYSHIRSSLKEHHK
ncbi:hypothetical protein ACVR05_01505 [Streptococcus caprae]|uniref:Uncharacterized protein n=1 Tax=Streptococcus caprae TaxID=1640501 RepID=A0ABV8CXR3_9STRE